ncbi:MAG: hypothetical protein QM535_17780 [Limnohabitans sp.]|nr:hypothetical protein [Limnohabitans sp.]
MSNRSKKVIVELSQKKATFDEEKAGILKNLEKSQLLLDEALAGKSKLSQELTNEKEKIKSLISELENTKQLNDEKIRNFKKGSDEADARILALLKEVDLYKNKIDSTNTILKKERKVKDTLINSNKKLAHSNEKLTTKITSAAKLSYYSFQTKTYKFKDSGKLIETNNSSRVNLVKISFIIGENSLASQGDNQYYVQIIDANNNILGEKKTENINGKSMIYSSSKRIKYIGQTTDVEFNVFVNDLSKGTYYVNVFDKTSLILKSTFDLK